MPEQDNDRLERFFQKAANQPEIPFDELDWKKLEARLDAAGYRAAAYQRQSLRVAGGAALLIALMWTGMYWRAGSSDTSPAASSQQESSGITVADSVNGQDLDRETLSLQRPGIPEERKKDINLNQSGDSERSVSPADRAETAERSATVKEGVIAQQARVTNASPIPPDGGAPARKSGDGKATSLASTTALPDNKVYHELIRTSPALAVKIKQKASVSLPGAEEAIGRKGASLVEEQEQEYEDSPRLSLLLSFAPDFSGTTMRRYSTPGKSFGAMIHYHAGHRWRFSTGIVKSNKKYEGKGADYRPPQNYWKYATNGVIPASIDGTCNIVEIPVMAQYNVRTWRRNRLLAGAGMSSYIMLDESYRYYFEQPNPGAKHGWASKESSRFLWNMINLTISYEREIFGGLYVGVEPYVKIPVEEIGWTNLKLFSSGLSLTARYRLLNRRPSVPVRSRGPD